MILFDRTLYSTEHSRVENIQEQTLTNHDTLSTADRRRQTECCWDVSMPTWVKGGRKSRTPRTQRERMVSLMRRKMRQKMCLVSDTTTDEALGKASFNSAKRPNEALGTASFDWDYCRMDTGQSSTTVPHRTVYLVPVPGTSTV